MATRTSLYTNRKINGQYSGLPTSPPALANISWDEDTPLSIFDALELWLEPDIGSPNEGFPVTVYVHDGLLRGDSEDTDRPVVLDMKRTKRALGGHLLAQSVSENSLKLWVDGAQVAPHSVVEIFGVEAVSGFIGPKKEYTAHDVGKFVIENGVLMRVSQFVHTGHGKTVGGTDSPGVWLMPDTGDEGGGDGAHWRGSYHRSGQVPVPQNFDFYLDYQGYFLQYEDGTGSVSAGWRGYNPFEADGYWEFVTGSDGNPFRAGSGYNTVDTLVQAFNEASDPGDNFAVLTSPPQVVVAETVVRAVHASTEFRPVPYVPPRTALANPVEIFWGIGQSAAVEDMSDRDAANVFNGFYRLTFVRNAPDETRYGGDAGGATFLDTADVSADRSLITEGGTDDEAAVVDHRWFELAPGDYEVRLYGKFGAVGNNSTFACRLVQVTNAAADAVIAVDAKGERTTSPSPFATTEESLDTSVFIRKRIQVHVATQFSFIAGPWLTTAALRQASYYLEVERIA